MAGEVSSINEKSQVLIFPRFPSQYIGHKVTGVIEDQSCKNNRTVMNRIIINPLITVISISAADDVRNDENRVELFCQVTLRQKTRLRRTIIEPDQ